MFKSYWIIAITFGLTLSGSLQAQEKTHTPQDRPTAQEQPTTELPLSIPIRIIEDSVAAESRERGEEERTQREKDDLVAQQGMNAATQAMNGATQSMKYAAWVSTGLVGLGTALLVWTLGLTRSANRAARDAVNITEKIGNRQLRAYINSVQIIGQPASDAEEDPQKTTGFRFLVAFKNCGQTPAQHCKLAIHFQRLDVGAVIPEGLTAQEAVGSVFSGVPVGPNEKTSAVTGFVEIEVLDELIRGECMIIIQSRTDYVDFNGSPRFTEVCCRLEMMCGHEYLRQKPFSPNDAFFFAHVGKGNRSN